MLSRDFSIDIDIRGVNKIKEMASMMKDWIIVISFVLVFLGSIFGILQIKDGNEQVYKIKVVEKLVKTGDKSSKYLIFTETDNGNIVFENTDSLLRNKWNSSDIYARLKVGEEYTIKTCGYRVNFLSWYQNIIEVH